MDKVMHGFLAKQYRQALDFVGSSDLVSLAPVSGDPPDRFIAHFTCTGLVRRGSEVVEANDFTVGIWFPPDYLWKADSLLNLSWLEPDTIVHPNVGRGPLRKEGPLAICIGEMRPGMPLVDILIQIAEVISYRNVEMDERRAMSWESCRWARSNLHRFPVDTRPLRRQAAGFHVGVIEEIDLSSGA